MGIDRWASGPLPPCESGPEKLEALPLPAGDGLRLDDQEGRALLAPDFGEPDPAEAIWWMELRSRMAAPINGQLLPEGEILQGQITMKFED